MGRSTSSGTAGIWEIAQGIGRARDPRRWLPSSAVLSITFALGLALSLPARLTAAEPQLRALSPTAQLNIETPPNEKPYQVHLHFLRSNERRHDLFFSSLHAVGGGYLGVGADQNYTLAAVARAEVVWLVDIDGDVVDWHKIYSALIPQAATPAALLTFLSGHRDPEVKEALAARWDSAEAGRLWPIYLRYRGYLMNHLSGERQIVQRGMASTWLSNQALYDHVRKLMLERRVVARVGDLHGERTMLGIAAAAQAAGIAVRTVYISNVEQWFHYSPQFRRNIQALPHDAGSLVLRTLARGELNFPDQDRWHFSVQTLDDFIGRMEAPQNPLQSVRGLMPAMQQAKQPGTRGISWIGPVQASPPLPRSWLLFPPLRP